MTLSLCIITSLVSHFSINALAEPGVFPGTCSKGYDKDYNSLGECEYSTKYELHDGPYAGCMWFCDIHNDGYINVKHSTEKCNVCGWEPHVHSFENAWSYDDTYHWHKCTADGNTADCLNDTDAAKAVHNYGYSSNGNALTATCQTSGCAKSVTLTISASATNYSGKPYEGASLGDTTAWEKAELTVPTIKYVGRDTTTYTENETAPTNVGKYTAIITVDDNTVSVDFEIKQPEIDVAESDVNSTGLIKESYIVGTATKDLDVDIKFDIANIDADDDYASSVIVKEGTKTLTYGDHYTVSEGSIKVTLTKSYLNGLPAGTHNITIEITDNNSQNLTYPITITVTSAPSSGGGSSTTPSTAESSTPTYKVPNTSVGYDNNPMNKTIGLLSIALVAGCIARKKKDD